MGHSRAEKEKTHKRIVKIAAKRFREEGLAKVGIAELMKEAGLTVGGFYKHFDSRDDLVAEAVGSALGTWKRQVDAAASGGPPLTYSKLIGDYLNEAHRDDPGTGCAYSALAAEISRSDKKTRALASEQIRNDLQLIASLVPGKDRRAARPRAILTFSALVGAMALARAVSDEEMSREILRTVAEVLKNSASKAKARPENVPMTATGKIHKFKMREMSTKELRLRDAAKSRSREASKRETCSQP